MSRAEYIARGITAEVALKNWEFTFQSGMFQAARSWWSAYWVLSSKEA